MNQFFVPYTGDKPAAVEINGHRLVILATERGELEEHLDLVGGETVHLVEDSEFETEEQIIRDISLSANAAVVISPPEVELPRLLEGLKESLPWWQ